MAWDFSTEPEFQQQLDWMREFVREEIWPIETVFEELGQEGFERAIEPLREQVKERGLWAAHLPPDLGGQGFGHLSGPLIQVDEVAVLVQFQGACPYGQGVHSQVLTLS